MSNYSLEDILKNTIYRPKDDDGTLDLDKQIISSGYNDYLKDVEWTRVLDNIDVGFIEQYLRKKKLEKLKQK